MAAAFRAAQIKRRFDFEVEIMKKSFGEAESSFSLLRIHSATAVPNFSNFFLTDEKT
jgi:hypothetical protein